MIRFKLILLYLIIHGIIFNCQAQNWDANNIPDSLKKNAYAVVRYSNTESEIISDGNLRTQEHLVITILNKSGDFLNSFYEDYDRYKSIKDAKVIFYNSHGKKINSFGKKDFDDYSTMDNYTLFDESRVLTFQPNLNSYPYTVEYIYSTLEKEFISFPFWFPLVNVNVSLQKSEYKLILPENFPIRYKFFNLNKDFQVRVEKGKKVYCVSLENQVAIEDEPYSPPFTQWFPHARVVPETFTREEFTGSNKSWEELGKWDWNLKQGRDELSEEVVQEIKTMVKDLKTEREKILHLYHYLQSKTRYVNLSFGIGGHQPHPAMTVYNNGYGDCKALSNYLYSMLKAIGIKSYYTLIYSGRNGVSIFEDFPSQQFNHAILCVPDISDTIFLECTSQTSPAGFLGYSIDDRLALLVDENGGHFVRTRKFEPEENLQFRKAIIKMDDFASKIHSKVITEYYGQQYENVERIIHNSKDDQKKYFLKKISIPQFSISHLSVEKDLSKKDPKGIIKLDLEIENYVTKSGERFFLPLNLMNKYRSAPKPETKRINDLFISSSYYDIDSLIYQLPENISVEYLPKDVSILKEFGEYKFSCKVENNDLIVVREIKIIKGTYSKEIYPDFVEFYKNVMKADGAKALLKNKV